MGNPFEIINARLNNLEALTLEVLQHLRSNPHSCTSANSTTPPSVAIRQDSKKGSRIQNKVA